MIPLTKMQQQGGRSGFKGRQKSLVLSCHIRQLVERADTLFGTEYKTSIVQHKVCQQMPLAFLIGDGANAYYHIA